MRRQLDKAGENVLAAWLEHYKPGEDTRSLIHEALDAFGEDEKQLRFWMKDDPFADSKMIAPRNDLTVHVRVCDDRLFTLVRIIEEPGQIPADD